MSKIAEPNVEPNSSAADQNRHTSGKLDSAEQAIEQAKAVLGRQVAARYEATHIDTWMPTVPTSDDSPRSVWMIKLFDEANRYVGWAVLDEQTGDPLQVGHAHPE